MSAGVIDAARAARLVETYFDAKDHHRPERMVEAFAADAVVEMQVETGAIAFPPRLEGRDAITDSLVSRFGEAYEDVRSFCLQAPGERLRGNAFDCDWAVVMRSRADGTARVGCGQYHWRFGRAGEADWRVDSLGIRIAAMQVLDPSEWPLVRAWVSDCDYPWAAAPGFLAGMPALLSLAAVRTALRSATASKPHS